MARTNLAPAVTLRTVNGAWWFVDASGHPFVSLGLNHVEPSLLLGPHNLRQTLKRYGGDFANLDGTPNLGSDAVRRWLKRVRADMDRWGFNTFGYHTGVPRHVLGKGVHYVARACGCGIEPYRRDPAFPDVFSDEFARDVERHLVRLCRECRGDSFCLGYAFADCPPWQTAAGCAGLHPWVGRLATAPPATAGKQAWMRLLLERYAEAASVAAVYGLATAGWDALAAATDWSTPICPEAAQADSEAMLARMAERWYQVHGAIVRREDPRRLILGDKLRCGSAGLPDYLLPILADHVDVLCVEWGARFAEQASVLRGLHERTGLPVLLGNSAFSVHLDCHRPCSKGIPVASHREVGESYAEYLRGAMEAGFVVGWHYCGYIEGREGVSSAADPTLERQCGLLDPGENEYVEAVNWIRAANEHAGIWHARPAR